MEGFTAEGFELWYSGVGARNVLGLATRKWLIRLRKEDVVPYVIVDGQPWYNRAYIDCLAAKLRVIVQFGSSLYDFETAVLCRLQYDYNNPPVPANRRELADYKVSVRNKCAELVTEGSVVRLSQLSDALQHIARPGTVMDWASSGAIASVMVGRTHYMSRRHYERIVWIFTKCLLLGDAGAQVGLSYDALAKRRARGLLVVVCGPDGRWRVTPETLRALHAERSALSRPSLIRLRDAAELLSMSRNRLSSVIRDKKLDSATGFGVTRRLSRAEVESLRLQFVTINSGFEWLQEAAEFAGRDFKTMQPGAVCRKLAISNSTLTVWSQQNLLPYFARTLNKDDSYQIRSFVALYVFGLVRFVGESVKVKKRHAVEYRRRCAEARAIV